MGGRADETIRRPLMLSYTAPEHQQHRRVRVCLEGSPWSAPFGLNEVQHVKKVRNKLLEFYHKISSSSSTIP